MRHSRRKIGARKPVIAFVVEGQTETWYLQMLKENEEKERNVRINIRPEIPQNSKLKDQFDMVCEMAKEHKLVFWILDFDVILKETRENRKGGETSLNEFLRYRKLIYNEYKNVRIIVNNPCFEYWFLLHYLRTQKRYLSCHHVIRDLEKQLPGYSKTEKYFKNKSKDIYSRLKPNLKEAIENASAFGGFDAENPKKGMCEMDVLFMVEELKRCGE